MQFTDSYYDEFRIPYSPGDMRISPDGSKIIVSLIGYHETDSLMETLYLYDRYSQTFTPLDLPKGAYHHEFMDNESLLLSCSKDIDSDDSGTCAVSYDFTTGYDIMFTVPVDGANISKLDNNLYLVKARIDTPENSDNELTKVITGLPYRYDGSGYITSRRSGIWIYNSESCELISLCSDNFNVRAHFWDPDSDTLYFAGESYTKRPKYMDTVYEWTLTGGIRQICTLPYQCDKLGIHAGSLTAAATDLYGNSCLYRISKDPGDSAVLLKEFEGDIGYMIDTDIGLNGGEYISIAQDSILMVYTDVSGVRIWEYKAGDFRPLTDTSLFVQSFVRAGSSASASGNTGNALIAVGTRNYRELELYEWDGSWNRLSYFNEELEDLEIALPQNVVWTDTDGTECTGWIVPPRHSSPDTLCPGILIIHEGPRGIFSGVWHSDIQFLSALGYCVFYANMHGSAGVSREYADISGRMGTADYEDLMLFTDAVLKQHPQIDPGKLAVCGTSYGGYMTNWIIGHTDRFQTAISMSSISNWIDLYGTTDMSFCVEYGSVPGKPWTNFETYWRTSPICYAAKISTPALFMHGDEDYRCPLSQALQMYNALQDNNIKTRLVIFKGCSHHFGYTGSAKVRRRRFEEMADWLNQTNRRK